MAVTTKYHGKDLVVLWKKTGGSVINLSGSSRKFAVDEAASEVDTTTRDDMVANAASSLAGIPKRSATLDGLDTTPHSSRTWHAIELGDEGLLIGYPFGTGTGQPYDSVTAIVTSSRYQNPHDGPADWALGWNYKSAVEKGTTS